VGLASAVARAWTWTWIQASLLGHRHARFGRHKVQVPPFFPAEQVDESKILKQQAAYLKDQLEDIEERLAELEKPADDEGKDKIKIGRRAIMKVAITAQQGSLDSAVDHALDVVNTCFLSIPILSTWKLFPILL